MTASLKFSVPEILKKNGLQVSEKLSPEPFQDPGLGAVLRGELQADLEFSPGGSRILLTGQVRGAWDLACARCLKEFRAPFANPVDETYPIDAESIDCEEEVRQGLLLAAPAKPLCRPDCRGLCQVCGANLNDEPDHRHEGQG